MKIILWGINYRPESTGIAPFNAELAEYLTGQEHDVTVVTGFPYYPRWQKAPEDRRRLFRREEIRGVKVLRCAQYVPRTVTTLRRIAHELSFGIMSLLRVLFLPRADVYVVVSPPLILGFFAWIATRIKRSDYVFHVQDLQPGAAVGLGMVKGQTFIKLLFALEHFAYRHAAAVSGISDGMMLEFRRKGVPAGRRVYFPNWLRGGETPAAERGAFRRKFNIPDEALLAVYSGNLGRKQGIEILVDAAQKLSANARGKVVMVIAGAGAAREELAAKVDALALPALKLLPLLSDEEYAQMLRDTDLGLITQAKGTGQFFFPSKLLSLLHAGVPVVTVADTESELARAVAEGQFGVNVLPGRASDLAAALEQLEGHRGQVAALAERTRWVQRFSPAAVLPQYEQALEAVVAGGVAAPGLVGQHEPTGV